MTCLLSRIPRFEAIPYQCTPHQRRRRSNHPPHPEIQNAEPISTRQISDEVLWQVLWHCWDPRLPRVEPAQPVDTLQKVAVETYAMVIEHANQLFL